jgi:propanol-preferring alcohol dehydrogenase
VNLSRIPDGMRLDDAAPILCAGVTVYKALKQSNAKTGNWVALRRYRLHAGASGTYSALSGSRSWRWPWSSRDSIRQLDGFAGHRYRRESLRNVRGRANLTYTIPQTGAAKKKLCEELGIEAWIDFKETKDIVAAIKNATEDGFGPHAAIVTSASPSGYEQALDYIRPGGTVVAVGLPAGAKVSAEVFWHVVYERKLVGSYVGNRQDAHEGQFAALI